ncbi:MAG: DUF979 family protein [Caulobacteraceae bacterium]
MKALITVDGLSHLIGLVLAAIAVAMLRDRSNAKRYTTFLFWGLIASCLLFDQVAIRFFGKSVAHRMVGAAVLAAALIAGLGGVGGGASRDGHERKASRSIGYRIFLPSLSIPIVTIVCSVGLKTVSIGGVSLFDSQATLCSVGVAAIVALILGFTLTKGTPTEAFGEARRILDQVGWVALFTMMLAILGGVFVAAKTGDSIKHLTLLAAPEHQRLLIVALYCLGMALFAMIMGNAFTAFPVMTAGLALPILIKGMGADPAPVVAIGMYSGYCGTLLTPMAANFNILPAAVLELKDRYAVIKAQAPTALAMLAINIALMYFLAFR